MTSAKVAAVIMASGFSRRMNVNKLLIAYRGKPLAGWVMDAVKSARLCPAGVITGCAEIARLAKEKGFDVINNLHPELGQSQSVIIGTRSYMYADGIMFVPADMPFLSAEILLTLKESFLSAPEAIIRPAYKSGNGSGAKTYLKLHSGNLQERSGPGSPVIFPKSLFGELCRLTGDRGGREIILRHRALVREVDIFDSRAGVDIDTPEDVQRWL